MLNPEKIKKKRVLIIGGAGFIGHNLSIKLAKMGVKTDVLDGLQVNSIGYYTSDYGSNPNSEIYLSFINERLSLLKEEGIGLHILDARDYHLVSAKIRDLKPDVVVHLAAIAHANRSNKDPYSTFDHSMRTLENVLDACRNHKIHVIFSSSSMVYGDFDGNIVDEKSICNPLGIYGALKYGAEKLIIAYNQVFDLPYTIIRPSALYGERCVSRRVGQAFIENALMGNNLSINGDGNETLDFTYIQDLIQGFTLAISEQNAINETFNITFGNARSLNNLAEMVMSSFPKTQLLHHKRDVLMPERGTLSNQKAIKLLGYQPEYPLEKGFLNYINWYKKFASEHPGLFG